MTTQYTPILKLALPVQGELSGTWGDVVNDNITSMIEQAIAGRSVVNTWTANSHVLTTANGTAAESRAAMLSLTDTGTALTGAGSVVCPALSKTYIVKNGTAQVITVKTASGSGIAVPVGKTMLVYCDGTNVLEGVDHVVTLSAGTLTITGLTTFASLKGADATTVTGILDEDNMASDSATKLVTQQSVKAYVDSQVGANNELSEVLANGNTTGSNDIDVDAAQKVQFRDASIYINSSADGQLDIVADTEIQIATATVDLNGNLDVSGTALVTGTLDVDGATQLDSTLTVGVNDTGHDVKFFGATSGAYMLWDESADNLILGGTAGLNVVGTATFTTVTMDGLTVDGDSIIKGGSGVGNDTATLQLESTEAQAIGSGASVSFKGDDGTGARRTFGVIKGSKTSATSGDFSGGLDFFTRVTAQPDATKRLAINSNGDISFYEDTGTTPKLFWDASAESLGIGTASPDVKLHLSDSTSGSIIRLERNDTAIVSGDIYGGIEFEGQDASTSASGVRGSITGVGAGGAGNMDLVFNTAKGGTTTNLQRLRISSIGDISFYEDTGTTPKLFWDASAESLGIGTSSPTANLEISSASNPEISIASTAGATSNFLNFKAISHTQQIQTQLKTIDNGDFTSDLAFLFKATGTDGALTEKMRIESSGNVGIGTSSPGAKLDVAYGNIGAGNKGVKLSGSTSYIADGSFATAVDISHTYSSNDGSFKALNIDLTDAGTNNQTLYGLYVTAEANYFSGSVGIGTSSPATLIEASGSSTSTTTGISSPLGLTLRNIDTTDGNYTTIQNRDGNGDQNAEIKFINASHAGNTGAIAFTTRSATGEFAEKVRISPSGNVGIGNSNPAYQLDAGTLGHNSTGELLITGGNSASNDYTQTTLLRLRATSINPNAPAHNLASAVGEIRFDHTDLAGNASRGDIKFYTNPGNNASDPLERMSLYGTGAVIINETGLDSDFRVESDAYASMLFVDGGNNCVSVGGGNSPGGANWGFYAEGQTKDTSSNTYVAAKFASAGYVDTGEYTTMLGMGVEKSAYWSKGGIGYTRTAGYDVGYLGFYVNGTITNANLTLADEVLRLTPAEVVVNDRSRSTVDFRVESDGVDNMLFVDASANTVGIGISSNLHGNRLNIEKSDSATDGPEIVLKNLYRDGSSTAGELGSMTFGGWRDIESTGSYVAAISGYDATYPGSSGQLKFFTSGNGSNDPSAVRTDAHEMMRITDTEVVVNETSNDIDFRVESNTISHALFVDGATGGVQFGESSSNPYNGLTTAHNIKGSSEQAGAAPTGVYNVSGTANCPALNVLNRDTSTDSSNRFIQFYADVTSSGGTAMGGIVGNGVSNVQFAALSDVREKQNIEALTNSLDKITSLNPVEFDWIASGEHCKAGFIAQEVEKVFPEFVVENVANEGQEERKGLTGGMTGGIVAHLVKAIQEQQTLIESLTARITALEE